MVIQWGICTIVLAAHAEPQHWLHISITTCDAGPPGAKNKAAKQNLFLIYLDAITVVNNKRAVKPGQLQQLQQQAGTGAGDEHVLPEQLQLQRQLTAAAPNMPDFTLKDLQFILTFTGGLLDYMVARYSVAHLFDMRCIRHPHEPVVGSLRGKTLNVNW